jgi:predicted phosphoribosyltransferase
MSTTVPAVFRDRAEAGRALAARAERLRREAPVVLGIPAGGVPVAAEVAAALGAPLDVLVVRKLGVLGARFGAVAEGGIAVVDHDRARRLGLAAEEVSLLRTQAEDAADRLAHGLRSGRPPQDLVGRTVLLVDDGVGTGDSAVAAAHTARRRGAARVVLAVPIAGTGALTRLREELDEIVCLEVDPAARWYDRVERPTQREMLAALGRPGLEGDLYLPEGARGAIVLAGATDGIVLRHLHHMAFATVVLPPECTSVEPVTAALAALRTRPDTERLPVGVFGLGSAAELVLMACTTDEVRAVVAAGGRPDRAGDPPRAKTLLIVGGEDRHLLALARSSGLSLAVVPGAGHDFEEHGALEQVAKLAGGWFVRHLR